MNFLALLLALVSRAGHQQDPAPPQDPNLQQYQSLLLGLKFNYPKAWELTTNKKGESRILIPIANTSDRAVVEILPVNFRSEPTVWQLSQVGINKTMKRTIDRQWDEEILGVPVLLTKVTFTEKGSLRTSETGLVYTLGFNKMMYRITATPEEFDAADHMWRQVLESLRTWTGEMPTAEDGRKIVIKPADDVKKVGGFVDDTPHPTIPHEINANTTKLKPVKSPAAATFALGAQKFELHVPTDWKVESNKEGAFVLRNPGVAGGVNLTVFPVTGSDPPDIALNKASGASLNEFVKVSNRDEKLPAMNKAGAMVAQVWRSGIGAKGDLFTCDATCQSGDAYFLMSYGTANAAQWKAEQRLIQALLDRISIEPAP